MESYMGRRIARIAMALAVIAVAFSASGMLNAAYAEEVSGPSSGEDGKVLIEGLDAGGESAASPETDGTSSATASQAETLPSGSDSGLEVFFTTTIFRISRLISFGFHRFAKAPHPFFANCPTFPS